jgi:hypothetical protein
VIYQKAVEAHKLKEEELQRQLLEEELERQKKERRMARDDI